MLTGRLLRAAAGEARFARGAAPLSRPVGRAGGAPGGDRGDAHPRPSIRHGAHDRGGARAGARGRAARLPAFLRHARRGGAHRRRRRALRRRLRRRDRRDRPVGRRPAMPSRRPASRSSCRRCIRATRWRSASACSRRCRRFCSTSRAMRERAGIGFTIDAEEADRLELSLDLVEALALAPELAGWDGLGLAVQAYQKRALPLIDWLADLARRGRPAADGAAGQGRLLGQRDQAHPGARARRLSGLYPQGRDRCLLSRLRAPAARVTASLLSAIRDPQRAYRGGRPRNGRRAARLRVPAPARHGRGALRRRSSARTSWIGRAGSMRRSAATRICFPIWCAGCSRTAPTPPSSTASSTRSSRSTRSSPIRSRASPRLPEKPHPRIPLPRDLYGPQRRNSRGLDLNRSAGAGRLARRARRRVAAGHGRRRRSSAASSSRALREPVLDPSDRRRQVGERRRRRARAARAGTRPRRCRVAAYGTAGRPASGPLSWKRAADLYEDRMRRADGAGHPRGRADDPGGAVRGARGGRLPALLRAARAGRFRRSRAAAGPDRRAQRDCAAWTRRLRLHLAVEFSAGDLHRPDRRRARRRQCGRRQAGRADPAGRRRGGAAAASRPASPATCCTCCRGPAKRSARRSSPIRASPGSPSPARPRPRAGSTSLLPRRHGPIVPLIAETGGQNAMIVDSSALAEQVVATS